MPTPTPSWAWAGGGGGPHRPGGAPTPGGGKKNFFISFSLPRGGNTPFVAVTSEPAIAATVRAATIVFFMLLALLGDERTLLEASRFQRFTHTLIELALQLGSAQMVNPS